jgi:hypothetical protein
MNRTNESQGTASGYQSGVEDLTEVEQTCTVSYQTAAKFKIVICNHCPDYAEGINDGEEV